MEYEETESCRIQYVEVEKAIFRGICMVEMHEHPGAAEE